MIMIIILIALKQAFSINTYSYTSQEQNDDYFIKNKSVSITKFSQDIIQNEEWNGLSVVPPLKICSKYNDYGTERPLIASIGIPDDIKNIMISDSELFKDKIEFSLTDDSFKEFKSIEEMENYIKNPLYGSDYPLVCFGMSFSEDVPNSKYKYTLHFFGYDENTGIRDISDTKLGLYDDFQRGPDLKAFTLYRNNPYTYMMKLVNQHVLRKETNKDDAEINFGLAAMKYIDYREDSFGDFLGNMITFFVVLAYMSPLSLYVFRMVEEKENKSKEGMKIMGLTEGIYFLSYFIQYTIIGIFISLVNAGLTKILYTYVPYYILFFTFFLYSLDVFALIFFFQSFIDKTKIALVLSIVIYLIMFCFSLACSGENNAQYLKIILSLFPAVSMNNSFIILSKFEKYFRRFHNRDFLKEYTNFSVGISYLMYVVDFFLFLFIGYYLQNVLPHDFGIKKPWYFLCTSEHWCQSKKKKSKEVRSNTELNKNNKLGDLYSEEIKLKLNKELYKNNPNFESEEVYKDKTKLDDALRIRDIVKIFGDGKKAVDKVNLNFYKDEIFALLGHNGAGKTTLISMLTGIYESSGGEAFFDGMNILEGMNMDNFRSVLGICPQHDILFDNLSVREHLEMFSIFKGVDNKLIDDEINKTLSSFHMESIQNMIAKNLSAGQRRKLSISISLIGGSKVIFLDEPSSGMDITSRRNLWEILKRQCDGKIIILTTHYMEEASVLGKRIGIINAGQMKCIGSPLFLIERFGKFMSLNITKDENANDKDIIDFISHLWNNVEYEILSEEILFRIPIKKDDEDNETLKAKNKKDKNIMDLGVFFELLDQNLHTLKIKSYSSSMPTLEDVFLNVAAEDNRKTKKEKENDKLIEQENDQLLFNTDFREDYKSKSKFINDFQSCFYRRYLLTIRDLKGFLMEFLCPIVILLIGLAVAQVEMSSTSNTEKIDISSIGKQNIMYANLENSVNNIEDYYINDINNLNSEKLDFPTFNQNQKKEAIKTFIEKMFDITKNTEDSSKKEIDMNEDNYVGYYASLLMLNEDTVNNKYEFFELLNARVKHGVPIYTHYLLKKIIEKACGHKIDIESTYYPMPKTYDLEEQDSYGNKILMVFFCALAFSLMPANFITVLVRERINNSKHLMRISGINIIAYWCVNYIFEIVKFYIITGICILLLLAFGYYKEYLYIFYITFGPGMISLTYVLSFAFQSESAAQNVIIILNYLIGGTGAIIIVVLRSIESFKNIAKVLEYIFALLPNFNFSFSYNFLLQKIAVYLVDYPQDWRRFDDKEVIRRFNLLKSIIYISVADFILYTIILIIVESSSYSFSKPKNNKLESNINDSAVLKEIDKVNNINDEEDKIIIENELNNNDKNKNNYSVRIKNLQKIFKNGCCSSSDDNIYAIKNLNFCVEPGECFGLLGLNGAGKTTTFKCITQELCQNNGKIFINGKNIYGKFSELNELFGYCPQFDAIFEYMSVYENLEFYARIKGVKKDLLQKLVKAMIKEMSLDEFTNKISGRLSGGNKRKLTVAISMLCNPPIILLDEPSTGMDPEARRFMWSVIHKMSTKGRKSSVIMTTHSMDEAETLCKRMGIMVNGEFVCLGRANQIKEKYGYGFEADVRIKPMTEIQKNEIYNEYCLNPNLVINEDNIKDILIKINKEKFINELKDDRLGAKIIRDINLNEGINISTLLNWIFFIQNALRFIKKSKDYFEKIYLSEHIDNNFLFKMKKSNETKSIGFFFGLFESCKEENFVTEYSVQQTSLEQIFNQFASKQNKSKKKDEANDDGDDDAKNKKNEILIDDNLLNSLLS